MSHKYIALIPAYEPGTAFLELLEQLQRKDFEIVIVDDGSGPAFTSLFEKASAYGVVLSHTPNKGKGYALKTGFSYIKEHYENDCMVVTVDADGQHSAKDASGFVRLQTIIRIHWCWEAANQETTFLLEAGSEMPLPAWSFAFPQGFPYTIPRPVCVPARQSFFLIY